VPHYIEDVAYVPARRPHKPVSACPPPPQVADPRRGTGLVAGYSAAAVLVLLGWGALHGFAVDLSPLQLTGFVALSACAGQVSMLVGPRTWYTPTTPIMVLAGLIGGPVAGALTGAASEALGGDAVWRQRVMGASRSAIEGFAAGLIGLLPIAGPTGTIARAAGAMLVTFGLAQIARCFVVHARGIQPARAALLTGAFVDGAEMVIVAPVLAALLFTQAASPILTICAVAALVAVLAVAERAHTRQSAQLERERTAARTDTLTSAPNRLALDEALVLEHARIVRGARPAGLYIVDLDRFKLANDQHGHDVGDAILIRTVERLRNGLRDSDIVARWGGDELIVLAPELQGSEGLEAFGERIRRLVGDASFNLGNGVELSVTASVGGTLLDGASPPEVVLKRADIAVYRAKQTRNASVVEIPAEARGGLSLVPNLVGGSFSTI
jgi:diguanylate cyclase (GGDEF)-like protein